MKKYVLTSKEEFECYQLTRENFNELCELLDKEFIAWVEEEGYAIRLGDGCSFDDLGLNDYIVINKRNDFFEIFKNEEELIEYYSF